MKSKKNCNPFPECEIPQYTGNLKILSLTDPKGGKSNYRLLNEAQSHLAVNSVEGCLLREGKQCDYLLIDCNKLIAYFIELKGSDLSKAVDQIQTALDNLAPRLRPQFRISARIVLTRVNTLDLRKNSYTRLELKLLKLGGTLQKASNAVFEESNYAH